MSNNINQEMLIMEMLSLELEEQENNIDWLILEIGNINGVNTVLSKKRNYLLKDKQDLQNLLMKSNLCSQSTLILSLDNLANISFFKNPFKKYMAYKKMLHAFNKIR